MYARTCPACGEDDPRACFITRDETHEFCEDAFHEFRPEFKPITGGSHERQ